MRPHGLLLVFLILPIAQSALLTTDERKYLERLGYLEPASQATDQVETRSGRISRAATDSLEERRERDAIKLFQEYSGLEQTGVMDEASRAIMNAPQCGKPTKRFHSSLIGGMPKWRKINITYSFVVADYLFPDEHRTVVRKAFAAFSAITPLKFRELPTNGDIQLSFGSRYHDCEDPFDGTGHILAHAFEPEYGIVHFDADENWMFMGPNDVDPESIDFLTVAMHEIGHALGLDHSRRRGALMHAIHVPPVDARGRYAAPKIDQEATEDIQYLYGKAPVNSGGCADAVYAALSFSNYRVWLFIDKGTKILEIEGTKKRKRSLSELFPNGPSVVTAAWYDSNHSRYLLFNGNRVWAYRNYVTVQYSSYREPQTTKYYSIRMESGYPKRLPVSDWKTGAAFMHNGELVLRNFYNGKNQLAAYNHAKNRMKAKGHVSHVFPNMTEHVAGFAQFSKNNWVGLTLGTVFKYDFVKKVMKPLGTINSYLNC